MLLEIRQLRADLVTLPPSQYPQEWVEGQVLTAPVGGTALLTAKVKPGYSLEIMGYILAAEESNTYELEWSDSRGAHKLIIPTTSAGTTVVITDNTPINQGSAATGDITVKNQNNGGALKEYQACILVRVVAI
jgi:hypothetical protein